MALARRVRPFSTLVASAALAGLLVGCAREAPPAREVRKATEEYFAALAKRDVKLIQERSTCVAASNSLVGGRVLAIEPVQVSRLGSVDSLVRVTVLAQRSADSAWAGSGEATADSLFRLARLLSLRASVYRNATRAARVSVPGMLLSRNAALETRLVKTRVRYFGPAVGPKPVDREVLIRLLRVPGGKWVVYSFSLPDEDPRPELN